MVRARSWGNQTLAPDWPARMNLKHCPLSLAQRQPCCTTAAPAWPFHWSLLGPFPAHALPMLPRSSTFSTTSSQARLGRKTRCLLDMLTRVSGCAQSQPLSLPCAAAVWRGIAWLSRQQASNDKHANRACSVTARLKALPPTEQPLLGGTTALRNWPLTARVASSCQNKRQQPPSVQVTQPGRMAETARTRQQAGDGPCRPCPSDATVSPPSDQKRQAAAASGPRQAPTDGCPQMQPRSRPI